MQRHNHLLSTLTLPVTIAVLIAFCGALGAEQTNGTTIRSEGLVVVLGGYFTGSGTHDLAEVEVKVDMTFGDEVLSGSGTIGKGSYRESSGVTFTASLTLTQEFDYTADPVTVHLLPGGSLKVTVKKSRLQEATFETGGTVKVGIPESNVMFLGGSVRGNLDGGGIDLHADAELTLTEPFEYEKSQVTAKLNYGQVGVEVKDDKFQKATLAVDGELELGFPKGDGLFLIGRVEGTYGGEGMDVSGSISTANDFEYEMGVVTASLSSGGTVRVEVKGSEFEFAAVDVVVEVDVDVPETGPMQLVGEPAVKYANGSMDIEGQLTLREPYVFSDATSKTTLTGGETRFRVKNGKLAPVVFTDLVYRVEIVVEGEDARGKYDDGTFKLKADDLKDRGLKALTVEPTGPSGQYSDD